MSERKMLYIWDIEKIIEATLKEHHLKLNYEFNNDLAAPMSFNVSTNTIKFNYLKVNNYISLLKVHTKETEEDYVKIILYHVLGYYLDYKKNKHDLRILMYGDKEEQEELQAEIEWNAWVYGRKLVPERLLQSYNKARELENILRKGC